MVLYGCVCDLYAETKVTIVSVGYMGLNPSLNTAKADF